MPNAVVKSYAKKIGKSVEHVERWWEEAKEGAEKKFKKGSPRYWAYVNGIVKRRAGLDESISFKQFLELIQEENMKDFPKSGFP